MYFNDVNIIYYIIIAVCGLFVGEFVNWMNKRLPDNKKVFTKELFKEYKKEFKPNYILMIITSIIYIAILYKYEIIPNRLNLTMFEIGLVFAFLYGISNVAISINMLIGCLVRRRNIFTNYSFRRLSVW